MLQETGENFVMSKSFSKNLFSELARHGARHHWFNDHTSKMKILNTHINKKCYVTSKFMQQPGRHSLDTDILEFPKHSNATY